MISACSAYDQLSKDDRHSLLVTLGVDEPQRYRGREEAMHDCITMIYYLFKQDRLSLV